MSGPAEVGRRILLAVGQAAITAAMAVTGILAVYAARNESLPSGTPPLILEAKDWTCTSSSTETFFSQMLVGKVIVTTPQQRKRCDRWDRVR